METYNGLSKQSWQKVQVDAFVYTGLYFDVFIFSKEQRNQMEKHSHSKQTRTFFFTSD